jgi:hypothetical protein
MERISMIDGLKNEIFPRVKLQSNILQTTKRKQAKWICHILRRKCLLRHVIDGKIDRKTAGTGRRGRKRKHVLDELKGKETVVELEKRKHQIALCQELALEEAMDM